MWVVENLSVWGSFSAYAGSFLATEEDSGDKRILFWQVYLGGDMQQVSYADLIDISGNQLPASIATPKVVVLQKSDVPVAVVGRESSASFVVAKAADTSATALVDLLIVEFG
jgi:hypothetical protein